MYKTIIIIFMVLTLLSVVSMANESLCSEKSGIERMVCLQKHLNEVEDKLNTAYNLAYLYIQSQSHIPVRGREEWKRDLDKARYNWISFRDAECGVILYEWWGSMGDGSGRAMLACQVQMTMSRIKIIQNFSKK